PPACLILSNSCATGRQQMMPELWKSLRVGHLRPRFDPQELVISLTGAGLPIGHRWSGATKSPNRYLPSLTGTGPPFVGRLLRASRPSPETTGTIARPAPAESGTSCELPVSSQEEDTRQDVGTRKLRKPAPPSGARYHHLPLTRKPARCATRARGPHSAP